MPSGWSTQSIGAAQRMHGAHPDVGSTSWRVITFGDVIEGHPDHGAEVASVRLAHHPQRKLRAAVRPTQNARSWAVLNRRFRSRFGCPDFAQSTVRPNRPPKVHYEITERILLAREAALYEAKPPMTRRFNHIRPRGATGYKEGDILIRECNKVISPELSRIHPRECRPPGDVEAAHF